MRTQAAEKDRVAVEQQVVRGDRGGGVGTGAGDVLRGILGGDVLEHHLQLGEVAPQRHHHLVDEHRLAVEQVHRRVGDLAVHQQQQTGALHRLQRRVGIAEVGDTGVTVGGGTGRVELDRHHAGVLGALDLVGRQPVGQVQRHQWGEVFPLGRCSPDTRGIGQCLRHGRDGRLPGSRCRW